MTENKQITDLFSFTNFRRTLLLGTGLIAILLLVEAVHFLPVTDENVHTESAYVLSAQRWYQGQSLYSDFRAEPYLITPFPPLWYSTMLLAQKAGIRDMDSLTLFARLFSFISLLGIAILSYAWNRKRRLPVETSLLSPTFYLCVPLLIPMAAIARQDLPALLLSFMAIFLVCFRPTASFAIAAGVCAGLGFLTKHSSVAAPISITLWLLSLRRWKHTFLSCAAWGVTVLPVMAYFQVTSNGMLMKNLSNSKYGTFGLRNAHDIVVHLMLSSGAQIMLALLAFALFGLLQKDREGDASVWLLKIYFIVSLVLALFAVGFANATANHFLEPILVWALLVPVGFEALQQSWPASVPQATLIFSFTAVLLVSTLDVQFWSTRNEHPDDVRGLKALVSGKRVLSDVSYLGARSANPGFLDPISLTFSERVGAWSSLPLQQQLHAHTFDLVILHWRVDDQRWATVRYPRLSSEMRKAIAENYSLCYEVDRTFFYAARDPAGNATPGMCPSPPAQKTQTGLELSPATRY